MRLILLFVAGVLPLLLNGFYNDYLFDRPTVFWIV